MALLEVANLKKSLASPEGDLRPVVEVEAFSLEAGAQVVLHGSPSGGMSTFLYLLAGVVEADAGMVLLDGQDVTRLGEKQRDRLRGEAIGFVFEAINLLPGYTCLENVIMGMAFEGSNDLEYAGKLLKKVGLSGRIDDYPNGLSREQQVRVGIARALASRPKLVLADEPTGSVEEEEAAGTLSLLRELCEQNGAALLLATRDEKAADRFETVMAWETINRTGEPR